MFLPDKYLPNTPYELQTNTNIMSQLLDITTKNNIPNIVLSGPIGSGKKTVARFFLESLYDTDINITRQVKYTITGASGKDEIFVEQSKYHIIIDPTNTNRDKYILQDVIKYYATRSSFAFRFCHTKFKTIVINNIETLAANSQTALRRTMENYASNCRFVILCNNISKLNCAIRSRCSIFCLSLPKREIALDILSYVSIIENINVTHQELENYIDSAGGQFKTAMWMLQCKQLDMDHKIPIDLVFDRIVTLILRTNPKYGRCEKTVNCRKCGVCEYCEYNDFINKITKSGGMTSVIDNQIRLKFYHILVANIDKSLIISTILDKLLFKIPDNDISYKIIMAVSTAEFNLVHGRRDIIHIELFASTIIKILSDSKN